MTLTTVITIKIETRKEAKGEGGDPGPALDQDHVTDGEDQDPAVMTGGEVEAGVEVTETELVIGVEV